MDKTRIWKTIAILLAVLFLVTVTVSAVSAACPKAKSASTAGLNTKIYSLEAYKTSVSTSSTQTALTKISSDELYRRRHFPA